jgi:hypothetical protein
LRTPWTFGVYGVPHTQQREYTQLHEVEYAAGYAAGYAAAGIGETTLCNRVALEDIFYTMLTDRSPFPCKSQGGIADANNTPRVVAKSTVEEDESPLGNASGNFVVMFQIDCAGKDASSPWIPLRMEGSGQEETIQAMDRKAVTGMAVAIRAAARVAHKEKSMQMPQHITSFMAAAQIRGGSQVRMELVSDEVFCKTLLDSYDTRVGSIAPSTLESICDPSTGCLGSLESCARVIHVRNLVTKDTARITLVCSADRGRKVGSAKPGEALGAAANNIKPDRRKAADFVAVLSRFHIMDKKPMHKSPVRAAVLHADQLHLSDMLWSAARRIRAMLPGALITGLGIEFGHDLGANKEVSSVYSIRLSLEAGDDQQEAHWQSKTLPLHITMAVVRPNAWLLSLPLPSLLSSMKTPTAETSQQYSIQTPTLGAPYMQPLVVAPNINKRRRQTSATTTSSQTSSQTSSRVKFVTQSITPCMPMCKYIARGILTPLAHAHASQGILWAKAVVAHMQNNEREAVQCARYELCDVLG